MRTIVTIVLMVPFGALAQTSPGYAGSAACKTCHPAVYNRWSKTRMANVVRDPKTHPDAIIPDLSKPDPLVKFTKDDIAFVYGSKWKQRYFTKKGDDYYPLGAQWDVTHQVWRAYQVAPGHRLVDRVLPERQYAAAHRSALRRLPLGELQHPDQDRDGVERRLRKVPRSRSGARATAVAREHREPGAPGFRAGQQRLHSMPFAGPAAEESHRRQILRLAGWVSRWARIFRTSGSWKSTSSGEQSFTHFADGTAHKNRMQGNDFVTSQMYTHGVSCFSCHDVHGTDNNADLLKPANVLCLECHGPNSPNGPHAPTIEAHTHHKAGSAGNECVSCHMPKIEQTIADVNVRAHTFKFITPATTATLKVPNACAVCHATEPPDFAAKALKSWSNVSPWRAAQ